MSGTRRPWTQRVFDLLADGPLHRDVLVAQASPWVPQGHAYRVREQQRQRCKRRTPDERRMRDDARSVSDIELHRIGSRQVINRTLSALVRSGKLTQTGDMFALPVRSAGDASAREAS